MMQDENNLVLSSVGAGSEIPCSGIYKISLLDNSWEFLNWPHEWQRSPSKLRFAQTSMSELSDLEHYFLESVRKRVLGNKEIGVLFSGGLDSTLIAAALHFTLPRESSIYLLSVSFAENAPDKLSAIESYKELCSNFPDRHFFPVFAEVEYQEVEAHKAKILELLLPKNTRMDFSIGSALYFASRGKGKDLNQNCVEFPGKILLSGLGADEVFGGYSRYRSAYKYYGLKGVQSEMELDLNRLWHRNLARDDRICSFHAKELRFPFLDCELIKYVSNFELSCVTDMDSELGEKFSLRELAHKYGIHFAANLKKRAIQFGSRIAQVCNVAEFGSHRKGKGWVGLNEDKDSKLAQEITWAIEKLSLEDSFESLNLIERLRDPNVSKRSKRHMMRVKFGDYTKLLS